MKSPHQAPNNSTPRKITLEGGIKMAISSQPARATPTTKTKATIYPQHFKSATG